MISAPQPTTKHAVRVGQLALARVHTHLRDDHSLEVGLLQDAGRCPPSRATSKPLQAADQSVLVGHEESTDTDGQASTSTSPKSILS
jgi:hypothetical protein